MENQKIILALLPVLVISLIGVFALSFMSAPSVGSGNGVQYSSDVCVSTTGSFDERQSEAHVGNNELVGCGHNIVTDVGLDHIKNQLGQGAASPAFDYIGLCNATASCNVSASGNIILDSEFATAGLSRAQGTYGDIGTGNWSIYKTFTATDNNLLTNKTGIFNNSAADTLLAENTFTLVTLQNNDQLTVNWTITVTNP